ncbi:MAG: C10 family peptidase [Clostridia bacterium]|nr:C10 family peptidase [Clostridia bacterium]
MAAALNALANTTSQLSPARIVVGQYEDLYAVTPSSVHTVLPDYAGRATSAASVRAAATPATAAVETIAVVDASEGISFVDNVSGGSTRTSLQINYLPWSSVMTETQGSNNTWCGAYATAAICRYVFNTSSYTAESLMRWAYPEVSDAALLTKSFSTTHSTSYGRLQGLSPWYVSTWPGIAMVKAEIDSDCPVYFYGERTDGKGHAFVCRGYNMNTNSEGESAPLFSVWNPWYTYTEAIYASTNTYTTGSGNVYTMIAYIRNWE